MTVNLEELIMRFLCLMVILSSLTCVGACFADSPNPYLLKHNVEIQGAKIISEGGYLWFHVVNHGGQFYVAIHFPSDVTVIGNASAVVSLETSESTDFYFQVPYYWSGSLGSNQPGSTKMLRFYFEIYNLYDAMKFRTESIEFDVNVISLADRVDNRDLLYLTVFTATAVIMAAIIIMARLSQQEKRKSNLE
jgi:hypothetical protein